MGHGYTFWDAGNYELVGHVCTEPACLCGLQFDTPARTPVPRVRVYSEAVARGCDYVVALNEFIYSQPFMGGAGVL